MQLSVEIKEDNEAFSNWLLQIIKQEIISNLNIRKLKLYETYIKESNVFEFDEKTLNNFNLTNVIYTFIKTLRKDIYKNNYVYHFNLHLKYSTVTFYEIVKLVNYGNMDVIGYPIITDVLDNIRNNLDKYEKMYESLYNI